MDTNVISPGTGLPLLTILSIIPFVAMVAGMVSRSPVIALRAGMVSTLVNLVLSFYVLDLFDTGKNGIQLAEQFQLFGFHYIVGVDNLSIMFIPLTVVIALCVLIFIQATARNKDWKYISYLMGYQAIMIGAFVALNILQFWVWTLLEFFLAVLLTIHSSLPHKRYWLTARLVQYWGSGLLMTLAGFLLLGFSLVDAGSTLSFNWLELKAVEADMHFGMVIFVLLFYGFATRMPLFPFHGWLPIVMEYGNMVSVTVFLVGIKLGVYATIRYIFPLLPEVSEQWAFFVVVLGLISTFYGALMALMQINIRRLLAFSVISHTGMLVVGIFCFNEKAIEGVISLSLTFGLAASGIMFCIGLIYERTKTTSIPRLKGLLSTNTHTSISILFLVSALTAMTMPGTSGFDASHLLMEGIVEEHGWPVALPILIVNVLATALLLWTFQRVFMTSSEPDVVNSSSRILGKKLQKRKNHFPLIERALAVSMCVMLIGASFFEKPLLGYINQRHAVESTHYPDYKGHEDAVTGPPDNAGKEGHQHD